MQAPWIDALMFSAMVGAAVMAVLWPLSRFREETAPSSLDADFYRQRLLEIDEDMARGLIQAPEAEAARIEAARRVLALKDRAGQSFAPVQSGSQKGKAALVALILIPLLSIGLYGQFGQPGQPDLPFASRPKIPASMDASGMMAVMAKIENHLAANPDDVQGWELVAPIYLSIGRFDEAVRAYSALLRLNPSNASYYESLGEALVAQSDGVVTTEAAAAFARALTLDQGLRAPRFYSALALEQDGRIEEALQAYQRLLTELAPDSEAAGTVGQRIKTLQKARPQ